ncbi:MAG: homocysteine S-methyltransferase family protein [Candidatus Eisenbacteria bacterium]|nr:homocysteine S-methyltransferase family protein [Candidatus Eisenbacteria bacterium]
MNSFLSRIKNGEILLGDGGMGTQLMKGGLPVGEAPETVNLTHPESLEQIAAAYLAAGADLVTTNTFGGSPLKLALHGIGEHAEAINRIAVEAARRALIASGGNAYVSGSCGPSGRTLKPYGDMDPGDVYQSYAMQMSILVEAGVDLVCIETMMDLAEAVLAVKAAKTIALDIPVMATMTFDATTRGFYTIMGNDIPTAAKGLAEAGADLIGSNCGNGIEKMVEIAREFKRCSSLPLVIQSNAGLPTIKGGVTTYTETPEFMAARVGALIECGVSVIGGCCGTTPEHIKAFRRVINSRR